MMVTERYESRGERRNQEEEERRETGMECEKPRLQGGVSP